MKTLARSHGASHSAVFSTARSRSRKVMNRRIVACAIGAAAALMGSGVGAATYTYVDTADQGLWTTAASWSPSGPPPTGVDVMLGNHSAGVNTLNVTYNYNPSSNVLYHSVTLNSSALNGSMIVNQTVTGSYMDATTETIGLTVENNTYNQSAGTNLVQTLNVATVAFGDFYNLSGTGSLEGNVINLGISGMGVFNQIGGTASMITLNLGLNSAGSGNYLISGGTAGFDTLIDGVSGTGSVSQNAGSLTVSDGGGSGQFTLGQNNGSSGVYNLSATGFLNADNMSIGMGGSGTFIMTGGNASIGTMFVGGAGPGAFNLSAGTATIGALNVFGSPASGVVNISGTGVFDGPVLIDPGGVFNISGGTLGPDTSLEMTGGLFNLIAYSASVDGLSGTGGTIQASGGSVTLTVTTNGVFSGTLANGTGTLGLTVNITDGTGPLVLSGTGTYSGPTLIVAGILQNGSTTGLSALSPVTLDAGATLNLNKSNATILSLSGTGGTVAVTTATLSMGGTGAGVSTTYSGSFNGSGTVQKTGAGTFTLAGTNPGSFNGSFSVVSGTLQVGAVNAIPIASTVNLNNGGVLAVGFNQTLAEISGGSPASVNFSSGSTLTVGNDNGASSYQGLFVGTGTFSKVGSGTFTLGGGAGDTSAGNTDASLTFNVSAGTLLLNKADGTNAIGGPVSVAGGTLIYARGDQIADTSAVTITAGTFNLAGFSDTIGGLTGTGGSLVLGGGTLTVSQGSVSSFSGSLGGTGSLIKAGTGILTLSNLSTYTGTLTASAGVLALTGAVSATGLTANSGGTLEFLAASVALGASSIQSNAGGAVQYSNATVSNGYLRGPGAHTILNSGTTTFNAITTYNSTTINQNGPSVFNNFTNGGTLNNNAVLTLNGADNSITGVMNVSSSTTTSDFGSSGIINVASGGSLANSGANLVLGGGSRTYVNAGGALSTATGTTIELNGGLLVNSGNIPGGIVDVNYAGLATGTGTYSSVVVNPGGTYLPGNYGIGSPPPALGSPFAMIQPAVSGSTNTSSPVTVTTGTLITVNPGDTLTLAGGLNAAGQSVTKLGGGTVIIAPFSATDLNVSGGTLKLSPSSSVLSISTLEIGASSTLDLSNNSADISTSSLSAITMLAKLGYANGTWNGSGGITSSTAAADSKHLTAIGVIQNNQSGTAIYTSSHQFEGTTPGVSDVLMKYTYYGDSNLDGKVDGSDYSRIDNGFLIHTTGWFNGDFNYDGVVNGSDYTLIDNAFNTQGSQLATEIAAPTADVAGGSGGSSVPEPTSVGLLGMGAIVLLGRRRSYLTAGFQNGQNHQTNRC